MPKYQLVFRKNGFVGLYNMVDKHQIFNTTVDLLDNRLKMEFGTTPTDITLVIEGEGRVNPLHLPTLQEYLAQ